MVAPPHVAPPTVHFTTKRTEAKRESSGARMIAHRHYRSTAPRRATHSPYISSKEPTLRNIFSSLFRNEEIMVDCCIPKVDCCVSIFPPRPDPLPSSSLSHSHFSLSSPRSATGTGRSERWAERRPKRRLGASTGDGSHIRLSLAATKSRWNR